MATYSFLEQAEEVLKTADNPLTYQEIWYAAKQGCLTEKISSKGKTPWQTPGPQLYVEVRNNEASRFVKVGKKPARCFLKSREGGLSKEAIEQLDKQQPVKKERATGFHERDLHPVLSCSQGAVSLRTGIVIARQADALKLCDGAYCQKIQQQLWRQQFRTLT